MSQDALGPQFAEHIAAFRDRFHERGWHDRSYATGACMDATWAFNQHLASHGVPHAKHLELAAHDDDDSYVNHSVTEVPHPATGVPHVVDWTARQFDDRARYPVVMPRAAYQHAYQMQNDPAGWEGEHPYDSPYMKHVLRHGGRDEWERP